MKKLNLITIFVLLHVNLTLGATYVLDLGWQDIQFTNSMALGESATLEIRNTGGAASAGIMVYLTDRTKSVLALCTNLTDGTITNSSIGTLNLATTNLAGKFTDAGPHAEKTFSLTVWDATANRMLASAPIVIRNNPIADEIMNGWTNIPTAVQNELEASIQGIAEMATEASEVAQEALDAVEELELGSGFVATNDPVYTATVQKASTALQDASSWYTHSADDVVDMAGYPIINSANLVETNTAAYTTAVYRAGLYVANSNTYVKTGHVGNVTIIGRVGIGTNAPTDEVPTRTNTTVSLHLADGDIYIENKPHLLGGGTATSLTAAIHLGYDAREYGRASLWLNSYDYNSGGNIYDAASDIYFGTGTNFTDASLRWGLSARATNQGWGHESDGQFLIYEFPGLGSSGVGGTRFSIFPDSGGNGGPIKLGTETRYPPPNPDTNATLVVNDWTKSPVIVIEGNTNAGAASFPRIRMWGGTNIVDLTWSNGVLYCTGTASFPMLALGTNDAVSNWPVTGITSAWDYVLTTSNIYNSATESIVKVTAPPSARTVEYRDGNVDTNQPYRLLLHGGSSGFGAWLGDWNTSTNMLALNRATRSLSYSFGTNRFYVMTNSAGIAVVELNGVVLGPTGITNNSTNITLSGTFTGEHVGNGASLTNFPLSVWANGTNYPASPSNTFDLGTIGGSGGAAGVSSLNALTGAVHFVAGSNVTLTVGTTSITVNASGAAGGSSTSIPPWMAAATIANAATVTIDFAATASPVDYLAPTSATTIAASVPAGTGIGRKVLLFAPVATNVSVAFPTGTWAGTGGFTLSPTTNTVLAASVVQTPTGTNRIELLKWTVVP